MKICIRAPVTHANSVHFFFLYSPIIITSVIYSFSLRYNLQQLLKNKRCNCKLVFFLQRAYLVSNPSSVRRVIFFFFFEIAPRLQPHHSNFMRSGQRKREILLSRVHARVRSSAIGAARARRSADEPKQNFEIDPIFSSSRICAISLRRSLSLSLSLLAIADIVMQSQSSSSWSSQSSWSSSCSRFSSSMPQPSATPREKRVSSLILRLPRSLSGFRHSAVRIHLSTRLSTNRGFGPFIERRGHLALERAKCLPQVFLCAFLSFSFFLLRERDGQIIIDKICTM